LSATKWSIAPPKKCHRRHYRLRASNCPPCCRFDIRRRGTMSTTRSMRSSCWWTRQPPQQRAPAARHAVAATKRIFVLAVMLIPIHHHPCRGRTSRAPCRHRRRRCRRSTCVSCARCTTMRTAFVPIARTFGMIRNLGWCVDKSSTGAATEALLLLVASAKVERPAAFRKTRPHVSCLVDSKEMMIGPWPCRSIRHTILSNRRFGFAF
jgi:hypothetical protein